MTKIYAMYDTKTHSYHLPFFQKTHGEAERFVKTICSEDPKGLPGYYSNLAKYPEDFDLYYFGDWDDSCGRMTLLDSPHHIIKCAALKVMTN